MIESEEKEKKKVYKRDGEGRWVLFAHSPGPLQKMVNMDTGETCCFGVSALLDNVFELLESPANDRTLRK